VFFGIASGDVMGCIRFNSDNGSNYSHRRGRDGTTDGTGASTNLTYTTIGGTSTGDVVYADGSIINKSDKEKLVITEGVDSNTAGASNVPSRRDAVHKWANTSDSITSIQMVNVNSGSWDSGSYITVWGADDQVVTAKDKSSITNVPVGTRYEEIDTKKIYRWRDEGFSANSVGIYGDLISNDSGTLTNPTSAPTGIASAGNTKCFESTGLQIKGRTGIGGLSSRNWFPSGSDWTIGFWFKADTWNVGGSNSPACLSPRNSSNTGRGWIEFSSGPGTPSGDEPQFNVAMYQNGGGGNGKIEAANYTGASTGAWHWMVIDWDDSAGTVTWSVDNDTSGVGYKTLTNSAITSLDISTIDYWFIGADAERFDGQITDVCFWNTLLTSQQKTNLWASGAGALATTESKSNIIMYHDCQSITFPITNKATSPAWVEKGTA
jgi:hypothetical protein